MRICALSPMIAATLTAVSPPPCPLALYKGVARPPPFTHPPTQSATPLTLSSPQSTFFLIGIQVLPRVLPRARVIFTGASSPSLLHRRRPPQSSSGNPREVNRIPITPSLCYASRRPPPHRQTSVTNGPRAHHHRPKPRGCHVTPPGRHTCATSTNPSPVIPCVSADMAKLAMSCARPTVAQRLAISYGPGP